MGCVLVAANLLQFMGVSFLSFNENPLTHEYREEGKIQAGPATHRDNLMEMPASFPLTRPEKTSELSTGSLKGDCGETGIQFRRGVIENRGGKSTNRSKPRNHSVRIIGANPGK